MSADKFPPALVAVSAAVVVVSAVTLVETTVVVVSAPVVVVSAVTLVETTVVVVSAPVVVVSAVTLVETTVVVVSAAVEEQATSRKTPKSVRSGARCTGPQ